MRPGIVNILTTVHILIHQQKQKGRVAKIKDRKSLSESAKQTYLHIYLGSPPSVIHARRLGVCSVWIQRLLLPVPLLQAGLTQWQEMAVTACFVSV